VPSFTCSGNGVRRRISYLIEIPAPQVSCPTGGSPVFTPGACTSNLGSCVPNADGSATWTYDSPGRGSDATVVLTRPLTVFCGDCSVVCTTQLTMAFDVQDNGNCRIQTRVIGSTSTCLPA
jgi:hypothetical protein